MMIYCTNCGQQMSKSVRFCPACGEPNHSVYGTAVNIDQLNTENNNERQMEWTGKVYKCPNCGEIIQSFQTHCPACGLEFRGVKATSAVREFALKLETIEAGREYEKPKRGFGAFSVSQTRISKADEQKISLIQSFAIPNTKEDMLEFMILAKANVNLRVYDSTKTNISKSERAVNDAWVAKINQVYDKARQSYTGTRELDDITQLYRECQGYIKKAKGKSITKWVLLFSPILLIWVFVFIMMGITNCNAPKKNAAEEIRLEAIIEDVEAAMEAKDYRLALRHAESIEYKGRDSDRERWWNITKEDLIDKIIEEAEKNGVILERPIEAESDLESEGATGTETTALP